MCLLGCPSDDPSSPADAGDAGNLADASSSAAATDAGGRDAGARDGGGQDAKNDAASADKDAATTEPVDSGGTTIEPDAGPIPVGLPFSATFENSGEFTRNFQLEILHGTGPVTAQEPGTREWPADHNASCAQPATTRTLRVDQPTAELMYWCPKLEADSGHVHTSMRTTGFALVSFAPNRSFTNVHKICWDVSMADVGGRRWPQIAVVPEATYQKNGGVLSYVSGGSNAIGTTAAHFIDGATFLVELLKGSTSVFVGSPNGDANFAGFVNGTDKLRRFKHCVTDNENGTVTFSLERASSTETRTQPGSIPNGPVRVIFADNNYNPPKDPPATPDPNTMHWDNIQIE